jgi:hypothetical protein
MTERYITSAFGALHSRRRAGGFELIVSARDIFP